MESPGKEAITRTVNNCVVKAGTLAGSTLALSARRNLVHGARINIGDKNSFHTGAVLTLTRNGLAPIRRDEHASA